MNGQSYKGLYPLNDDTSPSLSVNPHENLLQCFGVKVYSLFAVREYRPSDVHIREIGGVDETTAFHGLG